MKKLAVLSIALLMLTALAFADVMVEPKVEFSGSGTLTWGIDLDTTANSGFKNEASSNLTVTLVGKSTETKGMMAEGETVYGYIGLKDMQLVFNSDGNFEVGDDDDVKFVQSPVDLDGDGDITDDDYIIYWPNDDDKVKVLSDIIVAPSVEAYVVLGPAKWFIYGAPDTAVSFAGELENDNDDNKYWAEGDDSNAIKTDGTADFGKYGTGIEVAAGPATITGLLVSSGDWEAAAATYGAAAKVGLTAGPATVKAGVVYPFASGSTVGFGGSVGVTAGPAAITVGFDGASTGSTLNYEVAGGVTVTLTDVATITANAAYGDVWNLDAEIGVDLTAVPDLTLKALVGLWDLDTAMAWGFNANVAYKVAMGETNYIKPGVDAYVSTENGADLRVVVVGTVEAVLIPNTTFTLTYKDKNLTSANYGSGSGDDRVLTFATKVAY